MNPGDSALKLDIFLRVYTRLEVVKKLFQL